MKIAIVKYNAGNIESVKNALDRLSVESVVSDKADVLRSADKVIFPGVGEASTAMTYLRERNLDSVIRSLTQPVLGICLGMQLLCSRSEENGTECLGILPNRVRRFPSNKLKVPHMGWNEISDLRGELFADVGEGSYVYFVHSFYVENGESTSATTDYGINFTAAIEFSNFYAVQFHTEKSGKIGEKILKNFIEI
ncbi:MAG: imidazole glycerol phosphate synthase subunit HisH [Acidobacteria bacterium]|nr:imidazole glycerol phosphate synthase subunit HisH [Acidobacteriota bacterium]